MSRPNILYVTDLTYTANGRVYRDEDLMLSARLGEHFDITRCDPRAAETLMTGFDGVVVRNSGPVIHYRDEYDSFRVAALKSGIPVFNELSGRADMIGKQYLVDLSRAGAAVIPTVDHRNDLGRLPAADTYVVKPKIGSDSIGMITLADLEPATLQRSGVFLDGSMLVQPTIDFVHEASFYFVDHALHYALFAPEPTRRWKLVPFTPSAGDIEFAQWFVDWNTIDHGIQRVDACRTADGELSVMEVEDLNPYLSLDVVDGATATRFIDAMRRSIEALLASHGMFAG